MKYTLNFSLKLKKEGSHIVYDPEKFAENPIEISVPDVVKILNSFIKSFEPVGILEQTSPKSIQSQKKEKNCTDNPGDKPLSEQKPITQSPDLKGLSGQADDRQSEELDEKSESVGILAQASSKSIQSQEKEKNGTDNPGDQQLSEQKSITKSPDLKGLSGQAYICKSKDLDETVLNQFCAELTDYLQVCCSKFSRENFLSEENGLYVSGLREVLELRNYLARYTKSSKKLYQNGYLYIMAV